MMLRIDGAQGEGGGQVLRTALALSMRTGTPFEMVNVRAGRARPGLLRQHLCALRAAAAVSGASVEGDEAGSRHVRFAPGPVRGGSYHFAVGSAGSATLVLQTVLPALLVADGPTTLEIEGGTHNPAAPSYDFLARSFAPLLARLGADVELALDRPGFYPAGGGRVRVRIAPGGLGRLALLDTTPVRARRAIAMVAALPTDIALRQLDVLCARLGLPRESTHPTVLDARHGPGNVVLIEVERDDVTEIFAGHGERGVRAEHIAAAVADEAARYEAAEVPVGPHLADQLALLLAIGQGGAFRTMAPTGHLRTQCDVIERFLGTAPTLREERADCWRVEVG